jgi:hypothetical protein
MIGACTQVSSLACLELWMKNVFQSIPHTGICFHRDGCVQGYKLMRTLDLPNHLLDSGGGSGKGESFSRVDWVAVPQALRTRRVSRCRWASCSAQGGVSAVGGDGPRSFHPRVHEHALLSGWRHVLAVPRRRLG